MAHRPTVGHRRRLAVADLVRPLTRARIRLNRGGHIRVIPTTDPDYQHVDDRRQDAESLNAGS